mgnify:FL=1
MNGISPKLPLMLDFADGAYGNNKTIKESVIQNLKHMLLTNKGERVMDPDFGVGLYSFLFEPQTESSYPGIETEIVRQVNKYMPFIEVEEVIFQTGDPTRGEPSELLRIRVGFIITPLKTVAVLDINSDLN